tara:strand:- start:139 stop:417 length:279 start_codon:yes stop_codon:yes gene_type:complete
MLIFDHLPTKLPKTAQEVAQGSIFVQRDIWAKWVLAQDMFLLQKTTFVHNAYLCIETLCQFKVDSFKKTFKLVFDKYCHQILTKRGKLWNTL